jgi:hypothetical protein
MLFLAAVLVIGFLVTGFPFYRYQSAACKQRGAARTPPASFTAT